MYDPQPLKGRFPCRGASDADAGSTWNAEVSAFLAQRFEGFVDIVIPAFVTGYLLFFAIGGFLHVSAILLAGHMNTTRDRQNAHSTASTCISMAGKISFKGNK